MPFQFRRYLPDCRRTELCGCQAARRRSSSNWSTIGAYLPPTEFAVTCGPGGGATMSAVAEFPPADPGTRPNRRPARCCTRRSALGGGPRRARRRTRQADPRHRPPIPTASFPGCVTAARPQSTTASACSPTTAATATPLPMLEDYDIARRRGAGLVRGRPGAARRHQRPHPQAPGQRESLSPCTSDGLDGTSLGSENNCPGCNLT